MFWGSGTAVTLSAPPAPPPDAHTLHGAWTWSRGLCGSLNGGPGGARDWVALVPADDRDHPERHGEHDDLHPALPAVADEDVVAERAHRDEPAEGDRAE